MVWNVWAGALRKRSIPHTTYKITSQWTADLHTGAQTKNLRTILCDLGLGEDLLDRAQKKNHKPSKKRR